MTVCLPTALHERVVVECLRQGRHVLCEKPPALDAASAQRMADAARAAGVNAAFATVPGGTHLEAYLTYARGIFDFLDAQR